GDGPESADGRADDSPISERRVEGAVVMELRERDLLSAAAPGDDDSPARRDRERVDERLLGAAEVEPRRAELAVGIAERDRYAASVAETSVGTAVWAEPVHREDGTRPGRRGA